MIFGPGVEADGRAGVSRRSTIQHYHITDTGKSMSGLGSLGDTFWQ